MAQDNIHAHNIQTKEDRFRSQLSELQQENVLLQTELRNKKRDFRSIRGLRALPSDGENFQPSQYHISLDVSNKQLRKQIWKLGSINYYLRRKIATVDRNKAQFQLHTAQKQESPVLEEDVNVDMNRRIKSISDQENEIAVRTQLENDGFFLGVKKIIVGCITWIFEKANCIRSHIQQFFSLW